MGILFAWLAAVLASISNLFMRRSIDAGGSSRAYLVVQMTLSFCVMVVLNPVRTGDFGWNGPSVFLGMCGGLLLGGLMWGLGKALERGPPGLSFAFLNAATVMPGIVMVLLFGAPFGHTYTWTNGLGSLLVVAGLFWAGWTSESHAQRKAWLSYVLGIFFLHTLLLVFFQWWALVLHPELPLSVWLPITISSPHVQWFMPALLFVAALFQWVAYWVRRGKLPKSKEISYGIAGGICNGACTFFLILAPQVAKSWELAMIFPLFSVSIIVLCNLWARFLYREEVNWWANGVCVAGLAVGTIAWSAV